MKPEFFLETLVLSIFFLPSSVQELFFVFCRGEFL